MGHDHQHATAHTPTRRLWWAFGLTTTFLMIEVIGGLITQSLALLSDVKRSFGYHRFEILAATFNALLLFPVAIISCTRHGNAWVSRKRLPRMAC